MISRTAGEVERSKAALICWGILQVWLKSMQLFFHNSLLCKPLDILNGSRAATRFSCFLLSLFFFSEQQQMHIFPGRGRGGPHVQFLVLIFLNRRVCGGKSLVPCATALLGSKGLGIRFSRSGRFPESSATWESMNRENHHLVLRNFYLSFGSVM